MVEVELKPDIHIPNRFIAEENESGAVHYHWPVSGRSHVWRPPTDLYETENAVVVRVEIAGMRDASFSVILDENNLVIRGIRPDQAERRAFHQMEIRFGEFSTEVELHWAIDTDAIEAEYRDGFLWVILPKTRPQPIKIGS